MGTQMCTLVEAIHQILLHVLASQAPYSEDLDVYFRDVACIVTL